MPNNLKIDIRSEPIMAILISMGVICFVSGIEPVEGNLADWLIGEFGNNVWYYIVAVVVAIISFVIVLLAIAETECGGAMLADIKDLFFYGTLVAFASLLVYCYHVYNPMPAFSPYVHAAIRFVWLTKIGMVLGQGKDGFPVIGPFGLYEKIALGVRRPSIGPMKCFYIAAFIAFSGLFVNHYRGREIPDLVIFSAPLLSLLFAKFIPCLRALKIVLRTARDHMARFAVVEKTYEDLLRAQINQAATELEEPNLSVAASVVLGLADADRMANAKAKDKKRRDDEEKPKNAEPTPSGGTPKPSSNVIDIRPREK